MRTLNQPVDKYMSVGARPWVVVQVLNATTGAVILQQATRAGAGIEGGIESFGGISQEVDPLGGFARVSGAEVIGLVLDARLPLCTEATVTPRYEGLTLGAGRILSHGTMGAGTPYSAIRNALTGEFGTVALAVGRQYNAGTGAYGVYRGFCQFLAPSDLVTCEDAYIELTGRGKYLPSGSFRIRVAPGSWSAIGSGGMFNDFTGWLPSGNYAIPELGEAWSTEEYGGTVRIRLNAVGRAYIASSAGSVVKFMLVSERDANWSGYGSGPSGDEFVLFDAATAALKLRYNSVTLDNQVMRILYGFDPLPAVVSDVTMDLVWTGVVDAWELDDERITLTGRQNNHRKNRVIPAGVINGAGVYEACNEKVIGKAVPIVYGDFLGELEHRGALASAKNGLDGTVRYGNGVFVKGYVYANGTGALSAVVAGHALGAAGAFGAVYESQVESWTAVAGDAEVEVGTGRITIEQGSDATKFPYSMVKDGSGATSVQPWAARIPTVLDEYAVTGAENAVNADPDDWAELSRFPAEAVTYQFYQAFGITGRTLNAALVFEAYAPNGYTTNAVQFTARVFDESGTLTSLSQYVNADGQVIVPVDVSKLSTTLVRIACGFVPSGLPVDGSKPFRFRNLALVFGYSKDIVDEVYFRVQGRTDDGSGTVTGTAGALIENPAQVIEAMARNEMGLATAEIATGAFDTAAAGLAGKKLAFQILERDDSEDLLDAIGKQARMMLWWDAQDRLTCRVVDSEVGFPHSGTDVPAAGDIFTRTGSPVNGVYTYHPMLSGPVLTVDPGKARNDFAVYYGKNMATGEFSGVLVCNKDECTASDAMLDGVTGAELVALCDANYERLGTVNTREVEAWAIQDEATAAALLQFLVLRETRCPVEMEFTGGDDVNEFEPGDLVNVREERVEERFGTAAMNVKKWMIVELAPDLNAGVWRVRCEEAP